MLGSQVPVILACVVSFLVILSHSAEEVRGRSWALIGFGLLCLLCLLMPAVQSIAVAMLPKSGVPVEFKPWIFTGLAVFWSLLRGVAYLCLLAALVARPAAPPLMDLPPVPPVPRPPYEPR